jgi:hypothetical protein
MLCVVRESCDLMSERLASLLRRLIYRIYWQRRQTMWGDAYLLLE